VKLRITIILCILSLSLETFAQQRSLPGRVLFRIKPEAISALRSAFANPEIYEKKFDPQKFSLKDKQAIINLFSFPSSFPVRSLKPFIPQHNIVLEALRERTNPSLFPKINTNGIIPKETEETIQLSGAEEKISRWFELFFDTSQSIETAIMLLNKSGMIEIAEPRYHYKVCFIPNDPLFSQQYSLPLIHAPEAWDIVKCDSTMVVADDDIGADWTHPDLANAVWTNPGETGLDSNGFDKRSNGIDDDGDGFVDDWHGWDFAGDDGTAPDNDPSTAAQHGTHTSGIMAASGNNGIGICGVAFGSKVLILKCADNSGSDVAFGYEGIVYAADRGAKVVNNSWGGSNRTQSGEDIVNYARVSCVVVAAAGNSGTQEVQDGVLEGLYPALYNHVLSVDAVDESGAITDFSNFNPRVDVSAPGYQVLSTVPGNSYTPMSGTSMASPTAAGAIALVRQKFRLLSTDQAIQRLRATSDILTPAQDLHPGFTGKGRINVFHAVTPSPVFSARLDNVQIIDPDGNGALESGEVGDIILHIRNYLDPVTNLTAKVEFVNDAGHYLTPSTNTILFGKANTLAFVQNFQGSFLIVTSSHTPPNYSVLVKLTYSSSPEGYGPDVDYFTLIINKDYADLNKNNLTVSFDGKANIGYDDPPDNTQGSGFLWRNAPLSILPQGRDVLSDAGLMVGSSPNRLAAAAYSPSGDQLAEQDFIPLQAIHEVTPPDHANAAQELATVFADSIADPMFQAGITANMRSYAFTDDLSANAIVVDYLLRKRGIDTGGGHIIYNVNDTSATALFIDWDIGSSGAVNQAYISSLDSMIGVTRRLEDGYPYIGMKIISSVPNGAAINIYAFDNNGANGSAHSYGGFSQSDKWLTMTTPRANAGIGDVSMIYGLKNIPLLSADSIRMTFVLAMAENETLLKQTIDQTQTAWFGIASVYQKAQDGNTIFAAPNPFTNKLHIVWSSNETNAPARIEISDAIGRIWFARTEQGNETDLAGLQLPPGNYFLLVRQGSTVLRSKIICLR